MLLCLSLATLISSAPVCGLGLPACLARRLVGLGVSKAPGLPCYPVPGRTQRLSGQILAPRFRRGMTRPADSRRASDLPRAVVCRRRHQSALLAEWVSPLSLSLSYPDFGWWAGRESAPQLPTTFASFCMRAAQVRVRGRRTRRETGRPSPLKPEGYVDDAPGHTAGH